FGMQMPGRLFTAGSGYRYGFNGKENDPETQLQDYGFRIYKPQLGRFLSVDPLTTKYPMLTPFQFASNTPIQAIDLDGLEAFFIHGTMSNNKRWRNNDGSLKEGTKQLFRLQHSKWINTAFEWGGFLGYGNNPFNDIEDRRRAAKKLVKYIMANRKEGEDITLIAHSHGGNVAIQAAPMLRAALDKADAADVKINIITVATPAVNNEKSAENPIHARDAINSHIHIYNTQDKVQKQLANAVDGEKYERVYKNDKTQNIELDVSKEYKGTTTDAHSVDHDKPEVIKRNIDNKTIPKVRQ
ncbi:alpha/beta hydrolase, partial [Flaviaesturariibacter flavus]